MKTVEMGVSPTIPMKSQRTFDKTQFNFFLIDQIELCEGIDTTDIAFYCNNTLGMFLDEPETIRRDDLIYMMSQVLFGNR